MQTRRDVLRLLVVGNARDGSLGERPALAAHARGGEVLTAWALGHVDADAVRGIVPDASDVGASASVVVAGFGLECAVDVNVSTILPDLGRLVMGKVGV